MLDIGKTRGDEYLDCLPELLAAHGVTVRRYRKPTPTRTAPPELLRRIAAESQAVVLASSPSSARTPSARWLAGLSGDLAATEP